MTPPRKSRRHQQGEGALDLVESAIHLLRSTPVGTHLVHQLASIPFVLGLLWFWSDMTRGAHADDRLTPAAFGLTFLYVVMKTGQASFATRLRESVAGADPSPWTLRRWLRLAVTQATLQPLGFILFPLSFFPLLLVPTPWLIAFFQGVSVSGDAAAGSPAACGRAAVQQALRWPGQNHGLVGLLLLSILVVFLDVMVAIGTLPYLAQTFLGLTTDFALTFHAFFNTTVLLAFVALTFLIIDPLLKAIYVLRTFHAESITTGDDLRARLAALRKAASAMPIVLLALGLLLATPATVRAQDPPGVPAAAPAPPIPATQPGSVDPARFEASVKEVLQGLEYAWRSPRELSPPVPEDPKENRFLRWLRRQARSLGTFLDRNLSSFASAIGRLLQRLFSSFTPPTLPTGNTGVDWLAGLEFGLYVLLAAGVGGLGWVLFKRWRNRPQSPPAEVAVPLSATPDLRSEQVSADQLPEDGWLDLASQLAAKGDWRLALRALYLASLAHLARREFVRLAPSKTNFDYQGELRRRARSVPEILTAFHETAGTFDRIWYGHHPADQSLFNEARSRLERMRASGPTP